jgi:hypothetical protein
MGKSRTEKTTGDEEPGNGKSGGKDRKPSSSTSTKTITDTLKEGDGTKGGKKRRSRKVK